MVGKFLLIVGLSAIGLAGTPTPEVLIEALGSEGFEERQEAHRELETLARTSPKTRDQLFRVIFETRDLEVQERAAQIFSS